MAKDRKEGGTGEGIPGRTDGVLRIGQARAILMTESAFVFLQRVIHENMPELLTYGFYEMGYRAGLDLVDSGRAPGDVPEEAFRELVQTYRRAGYGHIDVVDFDLAKPEAHLRGTNLLESSAAKRSGIYRSPRAVDHYTRGLFAGLFSRLLGKEVICEELECEYRGDGACEFTVLGFGAAE
jgi:hypothetical protein